MGWNPKCWNWQWRKKGSRLLYRSQWRAQWKPKSRALVICKAGRLGKTVLWKDVCVWRPQIPKCTDPFLAHLVWLLWDGAAVSTVLPAAPSPQLPACPSRTSSLSRLLPEKQGTFLGIWQLRGPGKCLTGCLQSGQVNWKELGHAPASVPWEGIS